MNEPFEFMVRRKKPAYEKIWGRMCRVSKYRILDFDGGVPNHLVLYQIEALIDDAWVRIDHPSRTQDNGWYAVSVSPKERSASELCLAIHNHFMGTVVEAKEPFSVRAYLETFRPEGVNRQDLEDLDVWDTMLVQAMDVKEDKSLSYKTYGSFKVRCKRHFGQVDVPEPQLSGVIVTYNVPEPSLAHVVEQRDRRLKRQEIFQQGYGLRGVSIPIYHLSRPKE